jgi:hypothetical protein
LRVAASFLWFVISDRGSVTERLSNIRSGVNAVLGGSDAGDGHGQRRMLGGAPDGQRMAQAKGRTQECTAMAAQNLPLLWTRPGALAGSES